MLIFKRDRRYKSCEMLIHLLRLLEEDIGKGDITTDSLLGDEKVYRAEGVILSKSDGVLAGLQECVTLMEHFGLECITPFKDGMEIKKGDVLLKVRGDARRILTLERLALNIMMRMSGIASETRRLSGICKKYGVTLAGTRKTTPGFRYFEKKAISIGGGYPHRYDLSSAVLIKDNHVAVVGLREAVSRAKKKMQGVKIEVEVSSLDEAVKACRAGADVVLLDNLSPGAAEEIIMGLDAQGFRDKVKIEISGGVTPENLENYAKLRPDYISMGYLTTGVKWLDMSLKLSKI